MPKITIWECDTCGETIRVLGREETELFAFVDSSDRVLCWSCAGEHEVAEDDENSEE